MYRDKIWRCLPPYPSHPVYRYEPTSYKPQTVVAVAAGEQLSTAPLILSSSSRFKSPCVLTRRRPCAHVPLIPRCQMLPVSCLHTCTAVAEHDYCCCGLTTLPLRGDVGGRDGETFGGSLLRGDGGKIPPKSDNGAGRPHRMSRAGKPSGETRVNTSPVTARLYCSVFFLVFCSLLQLLSPFVSLGERHTWKRRSYVRSITHPGFYHVEQQRSTPHHQRKATRKTGLGRAYLLEWAEKLSRNVSSLPKALLVSRTLVYPLNLDAREREREVADERCK